MRSPDKLAVVHQASSVSEAGLIVAVLANAGITATVSGAHAPYPGLDETPLESSSGVDGCEVLVPRVDLERARQALSEARANPLTEGD